jgi:probable phosphoglycerate mutase
MARAARSRYRWAMPPLLARPVALGLLALFALSFDASAQEASTVVILVRHAERAGPGADPPLTDAGHLRARALATLLADAGATRVLATDYLRTRSTAAPAAARLGVTVETYDPDDLAGLAERLRREGGRTLVVGHSNTTPELVARLGGDPGPDMGEDEYDRLYLVVIASDGSVTTTRLRYGDPAAP